MSISAVALAIEIVLGKAVDWRGCEVSSEWGLEDKVIRRKIRR